MIIRVESVLKVTSMAQLQCYYLRLPFLEIFCYANYHKSRVNVDACKQGLAMRLSLLTALRLEAGHLSATKVLAFVRLIQYVFSAMEIFESLICDRSTSTLAISCHRKIEMDNRGPFVLPGGNHMEIPRNLWVISQLFSVE